MYSIRCRFTRIQSYAQAAKVWQKAVVFPKNRKLDPQLALLAPRGLVNTRKKHMTVERTEAEDIILRLYDHPVVTWHKDNSLTICGYNTKSTVAFGNHCVPSGMHVSICGGFFSVTVDGRTYKTPDRITFRQRDNTWKADQITPWSIPVVNRERARQALRESGYEEFRLWLNVYLQMASSPSPELYPAWTSNDKLVGMVRDRKWRELVTHHFPYRSAEEVLSKVRHAIYREYGCMECKSVPFLG